MSGLRPAAPGPQEAAAIREVLAAEDALATTALQALLRLVQQSTLYLTENELQRQTLEQLASTAQSYAASAGRPFTLTFFERAVYVGRRLLRASRATYATAAEVQNALELFGANQICLSAEVSAAELRRLQTAVGQALRERAVRASPPSLAHVELRTAGMPHEAAELAKLSPEERAVHSYALAVVVVRRYLETLQRGTTELPHRMRQVGRQLVRLLPRASSGGVALFVGRAAHDDAERAVGATLLALCMTRLLSDDPVLLSRVTFASLLCDVGIPRVVHLDADDEARIGLRLPALGLDQTARLPGATAAVMTLLGKLTEAARAHGVLVHEAIHLRHRGELGAPYDGRRSPTLPARIIASARRFVDLLSDADSGDERNVEAVLRIIAKEAREPMDDHVLRLMMQSLGAFPRGTIVELSDGRKAVVEAVRSLHGDGARPVVRLLTPNGEAATDESIDLSDHGSREPPLAVVRLVATPSAASDRGGGARQAATSAPVRGASLESTPSAERVTFRPAKAGTSTPLPDVPPPAPLPTVGAVLTEGGPPAVYQAARGAVLSPGAARRRAPEPASRGDLRRTPLVHLLVYALDNSLSGTLVLGEGGASSCGITLRKGSLRTVHAPDEVAPLEEMLEEIGVLVDENLHARLCLGAHETAASYESLVEEGFLGRPILDEALGRQLVRRLGYLLTLEPSTSYAYYDGVELFGPHALGTSPELDPLALIMVGARTRGGDPQVGAMLDQLGERRLELHPSADTDRLGLEEPEQAVVAALHEAPCSLSELLARGVADPHVVRSTAYALLITRCIYVDSANRLPVGMRPASESTPGGSGNRP